MELRVIYRGVLAGFVAGILGFVFAKIFAEPVIAKAIAYESGRDAILAKLNTLAGRPVAPDGPELFSRSIQSTIGLATGIVIVAMAMGALVAVAYVLLRERVAVRPRTLALVLAGFGFLGVYLLPFVKYPANPPAIGHSFTITVRGQLYLTMVACSLLLLAAGASLARRLAPRVGAFNATLIAAGVCIVLFSILLLVLPSLGDLPANVAHQHDLGFARAATETPQPITNLQGALVYPGFDADLLWQFRFYSVVNQVLIWGALGLVFGALLEHIPVPDPAVEGAQRDEEPAPLRAPW